MNDIFIGDIRGPLVPGAGILLGAAGRQGRNFRCPSGPEPCPLSPDVLPFAGNCPCGGTPHLL